MLGRRRHPTESERGQVVVFFALLIPVLFAIGAIVIDVGNWYVHKRHLQTQVDAAALASGPQFVGCFHDPAAANAAIASRALAYAGDTLRLGKIGPSAADSTTNTQLQEPNDVRVALNSGRYWQKSDGVVPGANGYGLDNTINGVNPGDPCSTTFLDVKATDDDAPPLWGLIPLSPSPKTHARVQAFDAATVHGVLPWAVPEIDPRAVVALFVDEDQVGAPTVFDSQLLELADDPALPWSEWTTAYDPLNPGNEQVFIDGNHNRTGVMILVSKNDPDPDRTGLLSDICDQDPGLVTCYGTGASQTSGLSYIHGYNGGSGQALDNPIIREVEIAAAGCTAADLSAPYFTLDGGAGCTALVQAEVDFGPLSGDPADPPNCVLIPGWTWSGGMTWTRSINLATGSGRNAVTMNNVRTGPRLDGTCGNANQHPNGPYNFGVIGAPYVANDESGPVQYLKLAATYQSGASVGGANSVEKNDPGNQYYNYFVTVGLPKPLSISSYTDPPLLLRMASPSGSQNQAWDCDQGRNFREEIETGCKTAYQENYRDLDGDGDKEWNNILCTGYGTGNLPPPTFNPVPRPDCVITETGDKTGQLRDGLHDRFETPCVDNNWPSTPGEAAVFFGPDGGGYGNDPRYVTLIITDDTAFQASGNDPLPIKYYAGFYVTGWDYHQSQSPGCPVGDGIGPPKGNDDHPIYGPTGSYQDSLDNGDVWGYFVDITVFSGGGEASPDPCEFGSDPAACIINLVE